VNPTVRPPVSWRRRVGNAFTENLPLKASALFLAIVLWILVGTREPVEEVTSVRFAPLVDSTLVLRDPPPVIRALVIGRPSEVLKLSNTPLMIRRTIANDVPDTLVMPLRTSDIEVPEGVEVIVRDVQPHSLTLRFEQITSRQVPVRSTIRARSPTGSPPMVVRFEPESVLVRGPRGVVARLRFVPTVSDSITLDTLPHLVDLDTAGLGVDVRPAQVKAIFTRLRP
jgi:hypothetical protein